MNHSYFYLGVLLLAAFFIQDAFALKWAWLVQMQTNETFKQLTGLVLVSYLTHQWYLSVLRLRGRMETARIKLPRHKQLGALAPLVFYLHSHQIGYAYLFLLSSLYFANVAIGLFNQKIIGIQSKWFLYGWMIVHVALSVFIVILTSYHVFIALYYE